MYGTEDKGQTSPDLLNLALETGDRALLPHLPSEAIP